MTAYTYIKRDEFARYFEYLDNLRLSGAVNPWFGAAPYLQANFGLEQPVARMVCDRWRATFNTVQTPAERAAQVADA